MILARFQRLPIRDKLLAMALLPLLVVLPLLGVILLLWSNTAFDRMLIAKIRSDLAVAQGYFERVLGEVGSGTAAIADSHALALALAPGRSPPTDLQALLQHFKSRAGLDFLSLRASDGTLIATDWSAASPAMRATAAPLPAAPPATSAPGAIGAGTPASIEVLEPAELALLAPALRARVAVPLLPTRGAAPTERTQESRAMVVLASHPVHAADGRLLALVQGGVLLNRNLPFIDHINQIVYPEGSLPFGSRGTATLFLDDVRISTNVRLFGPAREERAIGTRVSQAVREAVLGRGSTWLDRAFVVNDWYVSAYQPISDSAQRRVGMLYVGYLEKPFTWLKYGMLASIGAIFALVMIAAAFVSLRWAGSIFRPLEQMARTMQAVEAGEARARVGPVDSGDEIGRLAGHLDHLLDAVDDKTQALQRWNAELDTKVAERTRDLENAQAQLVRSEKLAAVGQLTASIAHEVNNPIAVIQGNLDLVRELLGPDAALKVRTELRLVDEQIERMRLIVTQLLQFARPTEFAGYVDNVDTTRVLDDCMVLVGHLLAKANIDVVRDLRATRRPAINRNELQQVLVNLLVNAIDAMPGGGRLELATRNADDDRVEIEVADSGPGLPDELLKELFQPFVTRKKDGTGLGLWISRSIVERYSGDIRAANRGGGAPGAVFTVALRIEPPGPAA